MSKDVRKLKDKAAALVMKGKLKKATKLYRDILGKVPDDLHSRQRLADVLAKIGDIALAIREYQHVAGRYAADGLFLKAVAIGKVIIGLDPKRTETQEALAILYSREQKAEKETLRRSLPAAMSAAILTPKQGQEASASEKESVSWETAPTIERSEFIPMAEVAEDDDFEIIFDDEEVAEAQIDPSSLPKIPLFSDLDSSELQALLGRLSLRWTSAGESIIHEGEVGTSMFVVIEGSFAVVREVEGKKPRKVAKMGPGTIFGEMALVTRAPRLATITSEEDGLLLELDRAMLDELETDHPKIREVVDEYYRARLIANLMRSSEVFRAFPPPAIKHFVAGCEVRTVKPGTTLLVQGAPDDGVFVVLRGRCEVVHETDEFGEQSYPDAREGDVLGEISTVQGRPCTATVRAVTESVLLHIAPAAFVMLFKAFPKVQRTLSELVEERLERTELLVSTFL